MGLRLRSRNRLLSRSTVRHPLYENPQPLSTAGSAGLSGTVSTSRSFTSGSRHAVGQAARDLLAEDLSADPGGALSVNELKDRHPTLSNGTLDRALAALGAQRIGQGKRGDPFKYFKPDLVSSQPSISRWEERNEATEGRVHER